MSKRAKFINDVYQGLYYYCVKYESAETAKSLLNLRLAVTFYLYYVSFITLLITLKVRIYGPFKPTYLEAFVVTSGLYFLLYQYVIKPSVVVSSFDDLPDERKRKVRLCLWTFRGSIAFFMATI
jgi:glucan phosphoethanolaminetransferase (alkaline phosphatase superfamily)